jgi:sulfoxide reductase heme-binding subunit YedZ
MPLPFKTLTFRQVTALWYVFWLLACLPFISLVVAGFNDGLGPNPVELITKDTGSWALYLLCITLAVTPVRKLTGWHWLARMRRMLGLMSFFYLCLHFTAFLWFEHFFDVVAMWKDVLTRPFIAVGLAALVILIPLAVTSWSTMMRLLGGKRWQMLHRLIYLAAPLAVIHFLWAKAGKNLVVEPIVFACIVAGLLLIRVVLRFSKKTNKK